MRSNSSSNKKAFNAVLSLAPIAIVGSASVLMGTANSSLADSQGYNTTTYENLNYANPTKWERPKSADTADANSQNYNTSTFENLNYANPTKWERPSQVN